MKSIEPATGRHIETYATMTPTRVAKVIEKAHGPHLAWKKSAFAERAKCMNEAAAVLETRAAAFGTLMAQEMGKPARDGQKEVQKCAWVCRYYAEHAESFLADEPVETDARTSFVTYRPLGVVLAVMPWNYPFWQVFRFAVPALMGGNAGLLKHASNVPGCALAIEQVFRAAGFPEHLFRTLLIDSDQVRAVIQNQRVAAVTLTGSVPAGREVAEIAGRALKPTVLELGGSDPYLILDDADLDLAVEQCVQSRTLNSGQSCIAAKRFLVVSSVREEFERRFVERMKKLTVGNPLDDVDLGPQARVDLRDELHDQVVRSMDSGAVLLCGGLVPDGPGAFYPPTVLTDVAPGMAAFDEELFGPVAAIVPVEDEAEAIRLANATNFGLGAAVFTADLERGRRIAADELEAVCCFVNAFVRSDPRLPFGGVKESGYGRELGREGIRNFLNVKTVYVA